jgi:hypothetical protein
MSIHERDREVGKPVEGLQVVSRALTLAADASRLGQRQALDVDERVGLLDQALAGLARTHRRQVPAALGAEAARLHGAAHRVMLGDTTFDVAALIGELLSLRAATT